LAVGRLVVLEFVDEIACLMDAKLDFRGEAKTVTKQGREIDTAASTDGQDRLWWLVEGLAWCQRWS
jgi:hypothetical protein